jgi:hypothetical protein
MPAVYGVNDVQRKYFLALSSNLSEAVKHRIFISFVPDVIFVFFVILLSPSGESALLPSSTLRTDRLMFTEHDNRFNLFDAK